MADSNRLNLGWMQSSINPTTTGSHDHIAIHAQAGYGSPTNVGQSEDKRAVRIPSEVLAPYLSARVEERRFELGSRVYAHLKLVLSPVTRNAR